MSQPSFLTNSPFFTTSLGIRSPGQRPIMRGGAPDSPAQVINQMYSNMAKSASNVPRSPGTTSPTPMSRKGYDYRAADKADAEAYNAIREARASVARSQRSAPLPPDPRNPANFVGPPNPNRGQPPDPTLSPFNQRFNPAFVGPPDDQRPQQGPQQLGMKNNNYPFYTPV